MKLRRAARWIVVGWVAVGCEPRHPDLRVAPDVGSTQDVTTQDAPDAGFDVAVTAVAVTAVAVTAVDAPLSDDVPAATDLPDVVSSDTDFPDVVPPDTGPVDVGPTLSGSATESCVLTGATVINGFGHYALTGTSAGRNDDHRPSCATDGGGDVGYLITLTAFSRLTWSARSTGSGTVFVPVVYLTQSCTEQAADDHRSRDEAACVDHATTSGGTVDLPAGNYYLVVGGNRVAAGPTSGAFELTLDVTPAETSAAYSQERLTTQRCSTIPGGAARLRDGDDVVSSITSLGFSFRYFGRSFDRLTYNSNGFLTFVVDAMSPPSDGTWRNHGVPRGAPLPDHQRHRVRLLLREPRQLLLPRRRGDARQKLHATDAPA